MRLENSVELLLENLQSCLSKIGLSQCAIESYETGSFITGKDAGALNTGIKIFGDLHEKNKEAYDEIYETEQKIKDEAEKRKTQGIWRTVGGAVLIATGVACIVLTGGAAIPIVADVAVAVGSGTAVFGAADAIEGAQDIYYGSTGDIDSTAVNGIKDDLFQGNEDAYYLTENAFAFAASAMIPIGHASTAGNLTFKSTATIVAKEGISMGARAGAQKTTTDVTGNDTAGMVAGMVASVVTAKGLNGIEAEANKLAKPKFGDVGDGGDAVLNDANMDLAVKGSSNSSVVNKLTSVDVKDAIEKNGMSVDDFSKLLDPNRILIPDELKFVDKVRTDVGLPQAGTVMNKTIPQSDIYNYLYDENFSGVRGFVSVDEHSNTLKTLDEVFEGNRLDYDNTAFKIRSGVDGVSKSVGNADTVYGKITYILDDVDGIKVPTDFPIEDNFPYTGRGFTGSKNIVLPELVQDMRPFVDGDILGIYDAKTGVLTQQFVYDSDLGWLLK